MGPPVTDRYSTIVVESADGIATITLNRPDRLNGMTNLMLYETYDALTVLARDPAIRVLVLTGAGRGFCPGADLLVMAEGDPGPPLEAPWFRVPVLLHEMPAVTVAAVNGACAGAGLGWAAACDLRYAARSARFNTAFLDVGVAGDMGLPWSLPRLVGPAKARELSFRPQKLTADEAARIGLVTGVFDDDAYPVSVRQEIDRLARYRPAALGTLKQHYVAGERMSFADFVDIETARHLSLLSSANPRAALENLARSTN